MLSYPWTEDDLFDNLTAADVGLTRIETDPLLVMLKRLEAASKLTSDTESLIEDPFVPEAIYWFSTSSSPRVKSLHSNSTYCHLLLSQIYTDTSDPHYCLFMQQMRFSWCFSVGHTDIEESWMRAQNSTIWDYGAFKSWRYERPGLGDQIQSKVCALVLKSNS